MGIFSSKLTSSAYVPPQNRSNPTLLGNDPIPAADVGDDLNRTPRTTVDLRFAPVRSASGRTYHGYIVVKDNAKGTQWTNEGGPEGVNVFGVLPGGHLAASSTAVGPGERPGSRQAASFATDVPAEEVAGRLTDFANRFSDKKYPYDLPIGPVPPFILPHMRLPLRNSNDYAGAAWADLSGTLPNLPQGLHVPGWGDHRIERANK